MRRRPARWGRDSQADAATATSASKAIRAMRPGQQETSAHTLQFLEGEPVWVVVRYTDSAGERWEYTDPGAPRDLAGRPVRVPRWDPW